MEKTPRILPGGQIILDKALEKFAPDTPADASGQTANANFAGKSDTVFLPKDIFHS